MRRVGCLALPLEIEPELVGSAPPSSSSIVDDLKLFGLTYAAGFLFVTLFLA